MILDSNRIPEGHSAATQVVDLAAYKGDLPAFSGEIPCEAEIDRSGGNLYIQLRFSGVFKLECSRCLEQLTILLKAPSGSS